MKIVFTLILFFQTQSLYSKTINIVQIDKTFMKNLTQEQLDKVFDDPSIEEENKIEELELKLGDKINFLNRDEVSHNVNGKIDGEKEFDVKLQRPGIKNDKIIELTKKGEYEIQCAIHPKMKIKLKVD